MDNDVPNQEDLEAKKRDQRLKILSAFEGVIEEKSNKSFQNFVSWVRRDPVDQQTLIRAFQPGFFLGVAVSIVSFAVLRVGPKWHMTQLVRSRNQSDQALFQSVQQSPIFPKLNAGRDGNVSFREGWILGSVMALIDGVVCLGMGMGAWFLNGPSSEDILRTYQDLPLQPGKSGVSDTLCHDFVNLYDRISPYPWEEDRDGVIVSLRGFVQNCRKRIRYEQQLRHERHLPDDDESVSIPEPGVPEDILLMNNSSSDA